MGNIQQFKPLNKQAFANQENIPAELKDLPQFVVWKLQARATSTKSTKIPYDPKTGQKASSTKPQTWATFDVALKAYATGRYDGIGFVFDKGYSGVDLDNCRDPQTGEIELWAFDIVMMLDSYTEISPSGTGLHILLKAKLDGKGARRARIELYDTGRYFTLTGRHLRDTPTVINDRQEVVSNFYAAIREIQAGGQEAITGTDKLPAAVTTFDDSRILEIAAKASNGAKFEALRNGNISDYGDDRSRADLALVSMLCFYSPDDAQVERMWKQSGLYRAKLERTDYIQRTIEKARARQRQSYGVSQPIAAQTLPEDISELEEIRSADPQAYGPPITKDPKRDRYLRRCLRNASLTTRTSMMILRHLGFKKNHSRFLNALLAIGGPRLGIFISPDEWLLKWYQEHEGKSSKSTLKRDRRSLLAEQREVGKALILHIVGNKYIDPQTGKESRYASKYKNYLLRVCLECISKAIDLRAEDQTIKNFDEALELACEEILKEKKFPAAQPPSGKASGRKKVKRLVTLEQRIVDLDGEWIAELLEERRLSERQKWEKFEKLQTERRVRFEEALERRKRVENQSAPIGGQNEPL